MSVYKITFPSGSTVTYESEKDYLRGLKNNYLYEQFKTGKVEQYHDELVVSDLDYASLEDRVLANLHDREAKACEVFYNKLTKEEAPMNNSTLDLASLIADNTPEGMEVCKDKSTESIEGTVVFKKKVKSTRWEDLGGVSGYYTEGDSNIEYHTNAPHVLNKNLYATQVQCKAHLAQAQLSQIMKEVNGDWEQNVNVSCWFIRWGYNDEWEVEETGYLHFLAFKSKELAEQVMRENTYLLEQYKPLAG
tara:strand:- start:294 stop:1037 length:744 start_codon:yes stop_codon:yes gene_type:complete